MDLQYSEEQHLLRDSVTRFVTQRYDQASRQRSASLPGGHDPERWQAIAELGWLGLSLPSEYGGLDGGAADLGILMEGLGRALVPEPIGSAGIAAELLVGAGSAAQQADWLPRIADGSARLAFAPLDAGVGIFDPVLATRAQPEGGGWRLDGRKLAVLDAHGVDGFIVTAFVDGAPALFIVPTDADGVHADEYQTQDGRRAAQLDLAGVRLARESRLADGRGAPASIARALDLAGAMACAEALGCMRVLLEQTVDYTKQRQQFGRPLAANQVLRHRMVDMAVACEEAEAIALRAALACDAEGNDANARARAVSGARLKLAETARFVAASAVQLHGAMGVTDELEVGAYCRRLLCIERSWGTRDEHLARCIVLRQAAARAVGQADSPED